MPKFDVTAILDNGLYKLYVNGFIHVLFRADEFIGFQSWKDSTGFYIEFYTKSQDFYTEYDKSEKWLSVLKSIDELI